ncbi:hypothetical protein IL306_004747 [Fusarium sp. DS 682]|nr:hypothetical protein IL306_004747 [Fusarium sp. DS 682]
MALPYRPIKPAPFKDGTILPRARIERGVSKRSGIIKSACWECRKRKAKCNGQKPVCVNCSKYDRECVYDSDIRESVVKDLQKTNEKLQEELDAAKLLLKQLANGSAPLRDAVSKLLDDDKQPSEITQLLQNGESTNQKMDAAQESHVSSPLTDPVTQTHTINTSGQVNEFESFNTECSLVEHVAASSNGDSYAVMESTTLGTGTIDPFIFPAPNYVSAEHIQLNSPSLIPPTSGDLVNELPCLNQPRDREEPIGGQTKSRSLFFQPLFNHNDYYLETSITTPIPQDIHEINPTNLNFSNDHLEIPESASKDMQSAGLTGYLPTEPSNPIHATEEEFQAAALKMHPNYKNHFGNLALSNSIRANGYPRHIQDKQIRNIFVPNWAVTTLNTEPDPGDMSNAFGDIYQEATNLFKKGEPAHHIIGDHPNIAALYDQEQFDRSCLLSQWAARMVHSVKCQGNYHAL